MRGLGSILTEGNILSLDFFLFLRSKASDANIGIIANVVCLWKTRMITVNINGRMSLVELAL